LAADAAALREREAGLLSSASPIRKVGLLVGRERSFPDALIAEVARRNTFVEVSYASIEAPRADLRLPYDVLVDRISHDVTCYQPFLKLAALDGVRVINNPFWRIADDKFFNAALAHRLGVQGPKTVLLPSHEYGDDITPGSLTNLKHVDWERVERELGYPMFLKPHWGGGWKSVHRVESRQALLDAFHSTGKLTMILQESISWTQYVRCIVIGQRDVLPALWDPRKTHLERYTGAASSMPPLSAELEARVRADALTLCRALGYDMNTVEFAIRDGVPYAIDFMNSAPDLDISSLGEGHFRWVIEKMSDLVIEAAKNPGQAPALRWNELLSK
jgi:glutathione synthase/RimK-type ligase-like ATP-grasp enzyme